MKHLIIFCHPNPASFNRAILEVYKSRLESSGAEVEVRDLYRQAFAPVLGSADFEMLAKGNVQQDIKIEQEYIRWAEVLTFIYPVWWFQMPATLKGYMDRVLSRGFAYAAGNDGLKGLLGDKKVVIINTTGGARKEYEEIGFRDALCTTQDKGVFGVCGMNVVLHKFFYAVPFITEEERKAMLEELRIMEFAW